MVERFLVFSGIRSEELEYVGYSPSAIEPLENQPWQPAGPVAFSPDGKLLATASLWSVVLWDWDGSGQPVGKLVGHKDTVTGIAFSPDGRLIASASRNGSVILWDVVDRKPVAPPLVDHEGPVSCLAFSPDGGLLVSGDEYGDIIVWDVASRKALDSPRMPHNDAVTSVAFTPDGRAFVSASLHRERGKRIVDVDLVASWAAPLDSWFIEHSLAD